MFWIICYHRDKNREAIENGTIKSMRIAFSNVQRVASYRHSVVLYKNLRHFTQIINLSFASAKKKKVEIVVP